MLFDLFGIEGEGFLPFAFDFIFFTLIGLCFGSFASAVAYRQPRGLPWAAARSRSQCTSCERVLNTLDLVPVFSWLVQKGRCRECDNTISPRYPLVELTAVFFTLAAYFTYAETPLFLLPLLISIPFLLALILIDLEFKLLPNKLLIILLVIGLANFGLKIEAQPSNWLEITSIYIGGFILYLVFSRLLAGIMTALLKKDALGMGDVKFFAVAGLWLGIPLLGIFMILSGFLGVVLGLVWKVITKEEAFPFGPALIVAFFVLLILDGSSFLEKALQYF
ncbi:MAG: prepilin peptidase [Micavibrio sp.]|nr:prepilin peptidase [Micavibrio sp.]